MQIIFTRHANQKMCERGANIEEAKETITHGEHFPAKHGRISYRRNFQYDSTWGNHFYHIKQVLAVTKKEGNKIVVITIYTFYF